MAGDPFVDARIRQSVKAQNRIGGSQERHECGSVGRNRSGFTDFRKSKNEPYRL
jgi:hypothetical protein